MPPSTTLHQPCIPITTGEAEALATFERAVQRLYAGHVAVHCVGTFAADLTQRISMATARAGTAMPLVPLTDHDLSHFARLINAIPRAAGRNAVAAADAATSTLGGFRLRAAIAAKVTTEYGVLVFADPQGVARAVTAGRTR